MVMHPFLAVAPLSQFTLPVLLFFLSVFSDQVQALGSQGCLCLLIHAPTGLAATRMLASLREKHNNFFQQVNEQLL